jgi:uncharacterized LabA/DUF88 family protein
LRTKAKKSAALNAWVESVPAEWRDRVSKSEKGVDIEICCDALKLASASRLDRLFFFSNDDDFLPMCRALKEFGANVSLIHLGDFISPNVSLVSETDSYDVVKKEALQNLFFPPFAPKNVDSVADQTVLDASEEKASTPPDATESSDQK